MKQKTALIIGAGPAGLTAAYELLTRTDIKPIIIEKSSYIGGISKTINYKNNRIDIGGHRFFSKSDRVMRWWNNIDCEMLTRNRLSRIYFNRRLFDYPLSITPQTISKLGLLKTIKMGFSYLKVLLFPIKSEKNLEDFYINRFGKKLYQTFFESYTHKVWGVPCKHISADWGAQRVKGISIRKAIIHFFKTLFSSKKDIAQKQIETSLIAQFLYPKHGPGELWEAVAKKIQELGGILLMNTEVNTINAHNNRISTIRVKDTKIDKLQTLAPDYVFSSMPIKDLVNALDDTIPPAVREVSNGLVYRDFITVGLLVKKLKNHSIKRDTWVYIQEPDVMVGRLQIFNNWSPHMVADPNTMWIGLEYFCTQGDDLWQKTETELIELAKKELSHIDIIDHHDVLDATAYKQEKAYPAYFGTYNQFDVVQNFLDTYENLFLIGRNGMHRYNNQDHSMLSAMTAVDNIINDVSTKQNIWQVNTEHEYHESK